MKIRTQLIISTVVFGLILLIISISVVITDQQLDRLNQQEQIASTLAQGANDLSYLSTEYLLHHEDLQRTRWESAYTSFSSDLSALDPQTPEQQALVTNIQGNQRRLKEVFDNVVPVYATSSRSPDPAVDPALGVLWSRMAVQTQGMGADATQLARIMRQETERLEQASNLLIFALMGTFVAFLFTSYFLFYRRTLVAIDGLRKGARIIGSGNLDYAIFETADDEIGELSRSFNRMTADLKGVTASKADLEREVAERKQAEEELMSTARFPAENPNPTFRLDNGRTIIYANNAARTMLAETLKCLDTDAPDEDISRIAEMVLKSGIRQEMEYQSGAETYLLIFVPFRDHQYVNVYGTNITERKRAEEALVRRTDDLIRLNRDLESAHREANLYLDILTHDIGNTENVSNLYTELLIDTMDGEAAGYVEKLRRSITKSIEILGTVSKIRRIHHGLPEIRAVELDAVIREEAGHYPDSSIRYEGAPYLVRADDLLPEIFANLIGNAVKHGGPDAAITVRTEEENGFVRVSVEDTGPGVPDADKQAIFHRYEQKKRGIGEGLGLYLVQILVERYGGRIWVEDRVPGHPERGAAFRFTLEKA